MNYIKKFITTTLGFTVFITYPAASFAMTKAQEQTYLKKADKALNEGKVGVAIMNLSKVADSNRPSACNATKAVYRLYYAWGDAIRKGEHTPTKQELNVLLDGLKKWNKKSCQCGDQDACRTLE